MSDEYDPTPSGDLSQESDRDTLKNKLLNPKHWMRLLLMMLMYIILFTLVQFIVSITMLVQWILLLFTGELNERLLKFSKGLNHYAYQIMQFLNFNSETRPFPLADWPEPID